MEQIQWKNLPEELHAGVQQISAFYNVTPDFIAASLQATRGQNNRIEIQNSTSTITYTDKSYFFRALGIWLEQGKQRDAIICENRKFQTIGVQADLSRNGAMTVAALKKYMDYMAAMGMNILYLYMEDMFPMDDRHYFGYLRGGYSHEELKELDDYAYHYGIELVPSIQVLGHHAQYLQWPEAADIRDTSKELLVDNEQTYAFIEKMIISVLKPLRTRKIFLGLDETHTLGLGKFLKKYGYEKAERIFFRHLKRVFEITDKLGVEGCICSDMFFNLSSEKHYYYDPNAMISEATAKQIPKNATLCYWHYGEEYGCDDYMLEKHQKLDRKMIFFGGSWTWGGHLPETNYALECTRMALSACERHGIDETVITIWGDDGNECNHFYSLLTVQYAAEYAYGNEENYETRFAFLTGSSAEAFRNMSAFQNIFEHSYADFSERFHGKALFWQDILLGQADAFLQECPLSEHYQKYADQFLVYAEENGRWQKHFQYIEKLLRCLSKKCLIAENLQTSYLANDKEKLSVFADMLRHSYILWQISAISCIKKFGLHIINLLDGKSWISGMQG